MNEIRHWRRWASWQWVIGIWLSAVVYMFLAGWLGIRLLAGILGWGDGVTEPIQHAAPSLSTLFVRWDSGYYLAIAQLGYSASGAERAFFPLYPLLVRWLSRVNGLSILWNGLILSVTAFGAASIIFYAWVRCDHSRVVALLATALLCFSPVSFFFVAFYAEPLFLAISLFSLYCARRGWFLASGIGIALASATRSTAFLLGVAYVIEVLLQRPLSARAWVMAVAGALLAPLGALAYFNYLGHPDAVFAGMATYAALLETGWDTRMAWPWELVADAGNAILFGTNINPDWFSRAYTFHDMFFVLSGLSVSLWSVRHMRQSTGMLLLASFLYVSVLHGPFGYAFDSAPRRLVVVAPIYLALALWVDRFMPKYRWIVVTVSALWLGVLAAWFASGRWVS